MGLGEATSNGQNGTQLAVELNLAPGQFVYNGSQALEVTVLPIGGGWRRSASLRPLPSSSSTPSGVRTCKAPTSPAYFPRPGR